MNDVQLVVALDDPTKGKTRDVLAEHVYGAGPILEQPYGSNTPKHTRYISGLDIEIPWPRSTAQPLKDEASDTVRLDVEMPTWIPSLDHAPFPPSVIDELRNKYSKYRTRHESEYVKEKKMEEYRKEYLQSQTMLTPRGQLRALKLAEKAEALNSRKDADGNMIMEPGTAEFIEKFMQKRKGNKAKSAA